jgi:hypothetical protein
VVRPLRRVLDVSDRRRAYDFRRFGGSLTYSANWDEVDSVLFWEQLDYVGVNAFYPLASNHGASYEEYARNAERSLRELQATASAVERPVLLVEIGYTTRTNAAVEPWLWPDGMSDVVIDEWEQARALTAIAAAAAREPWISGLFVWRYYANLDDVSQEAAWGFSPHAKLAERALGALFAERWASDPEVPYWQPLPLGPRDLWDERETGRREDGKSR